MEARIDNGIEMVMIRVLRQLPRNNRIINPVRAAAMVASRITPEIAARTKIDWSLNATIFRSAGIVACAGFNLALMPSMMSMVEAFPVLSTFIRIARLPSTRETLVWGM